MTFKEKQKLMYEEFEDYYSKTPYDVSDILNKLDNNYDQNNYSNSFQIKQMMYETFGEMTKVKVFKNCPFYFEFKSGIFRGLLGAKLPIRNCGYAGWILDKNKEYNEPFVQWYKPYEEKYFVHTLQKFFDTTHIIPGYENVFKYGLDGLKQKVQECLEKETEEEKIDFYNACIAGLDACMMLADRFANEAEEMLKTEKDPEVIKNLKRIVENARVCPKYPVKTFYQGLNTYWFIHEVFKLFDCMSIATIGHPDRELIEFYNHDIETGLLTKQEAEELINYYLVITDGITDYHDTSRDHINANMALTIGGQNKDGSLVYNEITSIILKSMSELKIVNPNMSVRVCKADSKKYYSEIAAMISSGCNNYSIINDEVAIESLVKAGYDIEDARIYGTGGCQEIVVPNNSHFSRAFLYINLPMLFNMSLCGKQEDKELLKDYFDLSFFNSSKSFDEVYDTFMDNFSKFAIASAKKYTSFAPNAVKYNPLPLYSTSIDDCISKGKDYTQKGAKYYTSCIGLVGVGSIIDMLQVIKSEVFEKHTYTFEQLINMIECNFEGYERDRQYLLNRVKKYGDDDEDMNEFAAKVFKQLAQLSTGMDNGFDGKYVASLFSYNWYVKMGLQTDATIDGRKKGTAFSRSVGPSESNRTIEISKAIHSAHLIDCSDYPGIAILYLDMPYSKNKYNLELYEDVLYYFVENNGFILQLNVVDREKLIEARKNPELHPNLVVRVCGFSEYFTSLKPERQDEMIHRNEAIGW